MTPVDDNEHRVTTERRGHVLLIGLDREKKRNAFDVPMFHQLCHAYRALEDDDAHATRTVIAIATEMTRNRFIRPPPHISRRMSSVVIQIIYDSGH